MDPVGNMAFFIILVILWTNLGIFQYFQPKGMNTLIGYDLVPEPKVLDSALRACRRLNDLASAVRILEAVKVNYTSCLASLGVGHNLFFSLELKLLSVPGPDV